VPARDFPVAVESSHRDVAASTADEHLPGVSGQPPFARGQCGEPCFGSSLHLDLYSHVVFLLHAKVPPSTVFRESAPSAPTVNSVVGFTCPRVEAFPTTAGWVEGAAPTCAAVVPWGLALVIWLWS